MDFALSSPEDETRSMRGNSHAVGLPAAVLQAAEWRYLVRMLYSAAGSPPIAEFARPLVQEVLWGHAHAGAGFFEALYAALTKPVVTNAVGTAAQRGPRRAVSEALRRPRTEPAPFEFDYGQTTARAAVVVSDDGTLRVRSGSIEDQLRPPYQLVPGSRPALTAGTGTGSGTRSKHGFTPPSPSGIGTIPDFVEALRLLQRWSGLNLRELEEQSKKLTADETGGRVVWLAKSTVSDMLNRKNKLPKPETLRAYTAACGVTPAEQDRWLAARNRLARGVEHHRRRGNSGINPDGQGYQVL
ncbi:MAG TPA: helix-turn-helix domain-containing protein [Actinospica sp.]|jgi:hypothetical protein|nr:helix-turn-helix domain-containing protein [Actinospica sp.]